MLCSHRFPVYGQPLLKSHILLGADLPGFLQPRFDIFSETVTTPLRLDPPGRLVSVPSALGILKRDITGSVNISPMKHLMAWERRQ